MRLCTSIPPITATTLCCSVPDPTIATGGDTMIGVAYFPAKSECRNHPGRLERTGRTEARRRHARIVYSCGALMRRARANRRSIKTLSV
jgi:hypothetical protein